MASSINYIRLLWNLYRQKRNAGRTKEQIEKLQKKKLEKLLLFAYENSPYYRKAFEAEGISPENIRTTPLENFPVLDKGILMENFDELVTDRSLKQEKLQWAMESEACVRSRDFWISTHRWQNGVRWYDEGKILLPVYGESGDR